MFKYFVSKEFLFTLLGLFGLGILFYLLLFMVILPAYTRHGDAVLVPDVTKLQIEEAEEVLEDEGLRFEVKDSTYQKEFKAQSVVDQYPVPLSRVKPGRKIFLTLNKSTVPTVKVPELIDLSLYQAKSRLESWKLTVGKIIYRPDIANRNTVLQIQYKGERISSGKEVEQGSGIDLVLSEGLQARRVAVPDLLGLSLEAALSILRGRDLGLGSVIYRDEGTEETNGTIFSQYPRPRLGDSIRAGSSVDVYIYGQEPQENEGIEVDTVGSGE